MLVLYDDSILAPHAIRQIIGVDRFADILKRKQRLGDLVEQQVRAIGGHRFVRMSSERAVAEQIDHLERLRSDEMVFRLPSSLMPADLDMFMRTLRKLPYSLDPAIVGGRFEDEAAALMSGTDATAFLRLDDTHDRAAFFSEIETRGIRIDNAMQLVDLRDVRAFLAYMIGATEARHFNATSVTGGIFRKTSRDIAKMEREYRFFHVVPEAMKRFLLPTFGWRVEGDAASYEMENLSVPDAAIQLVHHSFDAPGFNRLLDRFFDFIETRAQKPVGADAVRAVARSMILDKLDRRLADLMATEAGRRLDRLMTASGPYGGIASMQARAHALAERAIGRDASGALAIGHGDACLSNILFNRELGLFRLIDPRGALVLDEAYMHPLYDLAKFSHSVLGGYDFINNGLFECRLDDGLTLQLELDQGGPALWMRDAFIARLTQAGYDSAIIRTYELTLFLSMLPLHTDVPRKLPGFCLAACAIMRELEAAA